MTARSISRSVARPLSGSIVGRLAALPELQSLISDLFEAGEQGLFFVPEPVVLDEQRLYKLDNFTDPVTADGDPVGGAQEVSGNDNHLTQSVSADRPTYNTDGSLHWLGFDGAGDHLGPVAYAAPVTQPCTLSIAMERKDTTASRVIVAGLSSFDRHQISIDAAGDLIVAANSNVIDSGQGLLVGKHIITVVIDGPNSSLRLDGAVIATGNLGSAGAGGLTLSALSDGAASILQDCYGVVHVEGIDNVDQIESYLNDRIGGGVL